MLLPTISLSLDNIILLGFYLLALVYTVFSFVMYYHWQTYSIDPKVTRLTLWSYLVTTLPILILLGILTLII